MPILIIGQIAVSVILIVLILIQQRGAALGAGFGGGGEFYSKKRGAEKTIFWLATATAVLYIILAVANLLV